MAKKETDSNIVLLNKLLADVEKTTPKDFKESQVFEYFGAEQALKDYNLSPAELLAGCIGGEGDGGIDSFFTTANGTLLDVDSDLSLLSEGYVLEAFVIQSKGTTGFSQPALEKLTADLSALLDLSTEPDPEVYSADLIERVGVFRGTLETTIRKFPKVRVRILYITKGNTEKIEKGTQAKADALKRQVEKVVGAGCKATVGFIGARELIDMARTRPSQTLRLPYRQQISLEQDSYVALSPINEYAKFLTDSQGNLDNFIFESNVRDFQGKNPVNSDIKRSLESNDGQDFWWLNNGVTILCDKATAANSGFTLKSPQIVNGLQTSVSIFEHFKQAPAGTKDSRLLAIKIIQTSDEDVRNSIIIATNSQTNLKPFSIKAGEPLQKNIEQYFYTEGYFYDRRKNYYKNQGKRVDLIIPMAYLAQAVLAIGHHQPDYARARPSSLVKVESDYIRVFNNDIPLSGYLWMVRLQKMVDSFIRSSSYDQVFKSNMRFHLAMVIAFKTIGEVVYNYSQLIPQFSKNIDPGLIKPAAEWLGKRLKEYMKANPTQTLDKVAKSPEFVEFLISKFSGKS